MPLVRIALIFYKLLSYLLPEWRCTCHTIILLCIDFSAVSDLHILLVHYNSVLLLLLFLINVVFKVLGFIKNNNAYCIDSTTKHEYNIHIL